MTATIDYYFSPISPFAYLAGDELEQKMSGKVRYFPVDLATVFAETGGIPLGQRSKQRLDYRMTELHRTAAKRNLPINFTPAFFPTDPKPSTKLLIAARDAGLDVAKLLRALLRAVWAEERNIADAATLSEILSENGFDTGLLAISAELDQQLQEETQAAITAGVFGFPFYIVNGEPFWGQDRLDDAINAAHKA